MLKLRQGLSGTTTPERLVLMHAELRAISEACQLAYMERLGRTGSILCDAADLAPRGTRVRWARKRKHLYVWTTVYLGTNRASFDFKWKLSPEKLAPGLLKNSTRERRQSVL